MKGRTPTREEQRWMDDVRELGCIVCRKFQSTYAPAEIHHVDGKSKPGAHFHVLPLCYWHHREGNESVMYVSRHPHKARFEAAYGTEQQLLADVSAAVAAQRAKLSA